MTSPRRLKIAELEKRLGVTRQSIWNWYSQGDFPPPHYIGRYRSWFEAEVDAWERRKMAERAAEKKVAAAQLEHETEAAQSVRRVCRDQLDSELADAVGDVSTALERLRGIARQRAEE